MQINGAIHDFFAGDQSHKHTTSIYDMLYNLAWEMRRMKYGPDVYSDPVDVEGSEFGAQHDLFWK